MQGKDKCKFLRNLRKKIAEVNGIEYNESDCPFTGQCKGTCAKCDKQLLDLTQKINKAGLGVTAALGLSALALTGCTNTDMNEAGGGTLIEESVLQTEDALSQEDYEGDVSIDESCTFTDGTDDILMGDVIIE